MPRKTITTALALACLAGTAPGQILNETEKLLAPDAAVLDHFGCAVAVTGDTAIIGAYGDDDGMFNSGSVYVFNVLTGEQSKFTAGDGWTNDWFGCAIASAGGVIAVGASGGEAAYLFDAAGTQLSKLEPGDGTTGWRFGASVSMTPSTVLVGRWGEYVYGARSGSAFLFDVITGQQIHKLLPADGAAEDKFGRAVAIDGNLALVGAASDDNQRGSAYLFNATTGQQLAKLTASDGDEGDYFGYALAIQGDRAYIGAPYAENSSSIGTGVVYVFDVTTPNNPTQIGTLEAVGGMDYDTFGWSIALRSGTAIIGANHASLGGFHDGAAYLFDLTTGDQTHVLAPSEPVSDDEFGTAVTIGDGFAVVGVPLHDAAGLDAGAAFLFDLAVGPCNPADLAEPYGILDLLDINAFVTGFVAHDPIADLNHDGVLDLTDIGLFVTEFTAGCP